MEFKVPKFLERESTIAFGLTFKKLAVLGGGGLLLFILYYIIPNKIIFLLLAILVTALLFAFLFLKIKGQGLFTIGNEMAGFLFSPRAYFWQKKEGQKRVDFVKAAPLKKEKEKDDSLVLAPPS